MVRNEEEGVNKYSNKKEKEKKLGWRIAVRKYMENSCLLVRNEEEGANSKTEIRNRQIRSVGRLQYGNKWRTAANGSEM